MRSPELVVFIRVEIRLVRIGMKTRIVTLDVDGSGEKG
jgi:hypothetical protein